MDRNYINNFLERIFESRLTRNIAFWMLFGALNLLNYYTQENKGFIASLSFIQLLIILFSRVVVYGPVVYFNNLVLIPLFFEKRKYLLYILSVSILVTGSLFYVRELAVWFDQQLPLENDITNAPALAYLLAITAFLLGFTMSKFAIDYFAKLRLEEKLQNETLLSELDLLKSQINPHFLFNALNTIYGLSITNSAQTSNSIMQLSDILRYNLYETNDQLVPLEKEMKYIENYLEFARLRRHEDAKIDYSKKGDFTGYKIAPLIFIPFIENSFKHGLDKNIDEGWVSISIEVNKGVLTFACTNSKSEMVVNNIHSGIGLQNVKRRLDLLYDKKYKLSIKDTEEVYNTNLIIELNA